MNKIRLGLLLLLLPSLWLQAKPLQFDDEYAVFGGQPVNLKQVVGKQPVYIKFWATWCLDCRKELPHLQQIYEKYRDKIAIYAVNLNINETDEYILRLQQKHQLTIPIVMDNNGSIASNFEFPGTPFHVLINAQGEVVYATHKDDSALQQQLDLLAGQNSKPTAPSSSTAVTTDNIPSLSEGVTLVYFSATWCDWYMKDIHPEMSKNCTQATGLINQLHQQHPKVALQAYVTHLWTEEKDLIEYKEKHSIQYPVTIDKENQIARHYQTSEFPTLIIFKNKQEVKRYNRFDKSDVLMKEVSTFIQK
jgi:thiol-disulfide isomerase/thioredoxin